MVLTTSAGWVLVGIGVGMPLALLATRSLGTLLYATSPADPITYGMIALMLVASGVGATWPPTVRASRLDPAEALRRL